MAQSKNSFLSALASSVTSSGTVPAAALAPEVTADIEGAGTAVYDSASLLPIAGNTAGDTAFVKSTSRLYIHSGLGWYNVAVINNTPTVQSITDSDGGTTPFALATDGTPTTITITAQDSDGDPLTYNYSADSNFSGLATLSQDTNVFTITPLSEDSATTSSGSITFTVTDGINTATPGTQTFTLQFRSEYWDETALSIGTSSTNSLDNSTFIDRSTNAHTVSVTNTPIQTPFHPYLDNWSVEFNNDGYLSIPNSTDFDLDENVGFTIEFWIKPRAGSTFGTVFCYWHYPEGYRFDIAQDATAMYWYMDTAGNVITFNTTPNEWHHVAIVGDGAGTTTGYLDGISVGTTTRAYTNVTNGRIFNIGSVQPYGPLSYRHASNLSNFRFVNGSTVYSGNFTPPTEKLTAITNTKLLTCQSNRFIDNSSSARPISLVGTPKISVTNRFGQGSEYTAGENKGSVYLATGDEVVIAHDSAISAGTGDFCLQFWVYAAVADNPSYKGLVAKYSGGAGGIWLQPNNGVLVVGFGTGILGTGTKNVMDTAWHHIAWTRSGSSNKVFVDGEQELSFTASDNLNNTVDMLIGDMGALSRNFQGYVADLKYDVGNAVYTSAFTPPTEPVGNTNADLYLPLDNAGIFDKAGNSIITLSGDTVTSTTYTKYATTSVFTDTGGMLINNVSSPGTGDFCYEGWFYPTEVPGSGNAFISHGWGSYGAFVFYSSNTSYSLYMSSTGSSWDIVGGENINVTPWTGSWKHFAFTRSGNTIRVFLDGTQTYTKTISGSIASLTAGTDDIVGVGSAIDGTSGVHGAMYIENFQIHKNLAKYTTNFTPPTQEQGRNYQATS